MFFLFRSHLWRSTLVRSSPSFSRAARQATAGQSCPVWKKTQGSAEAEKQEPPEAVRPPTAPAFPLVVFALDFFTTVQPFAAIRLFWKRDGLGRVGNNRDRVHQLGLRPRRGAGQRCVPIDPVFRLVEDGFREQKREFFVEMEGDHLVQRPVPFQDRRILLVMQERDRFSGSGGNQIVIPRDIIVHGKIPLKIIQLASLGGTVMLSQG